MDGRGLPDRSASAVDRMKGCGVFLGGEGGGVGDKERAVTTWSGSGEGNPAAYPDGGYSGGNGRPGFPATDEGAELLVGLLRPGLDEVGPLRARVLFVTRRQREWLMRKAARTCRITGRTLPARRMQAEEYNRRVYGVGWVQEGIAPGASQRRNARDCTRSGPLSMCTFFGGCLERNTLHFWLLSAEGWRKWGLVARMHLWKTGESRVRGGEKGISQTITSQVLDGNGAPAGRAPGCCRFYQVGLDR